MGLGSVAAALGLLHHNPAYAAEAEGIRGFLGETWVHQASVMMHASGALLIAGALLGVLLMAHRLRHAPDAGSALSIRSQSLYWARVLVVSGWGLNLLGGSMRLFEPDHPGIAEIGTVAWVQVLLVKHIFILVALLASLLAVEWVPRLWRQYSSKGAAVGLVFVFLAAVFGGVSSGLTVPSEEALLNPPSLGVPSPSPGEREVEYKNMSFELSGNPIEPGRQEFPFEVDHWAFGLSAGIDWEIEQNEFQGSLLDPNGDTAVRLQASPTSADASVDVNLYPGTWILVVETEQALMETVQATIRIDRGTAEPRIFEGTVTVARDGFFELNFWMDPGDDLQYNWSVPGAHGPVYWDIHTHPDGEVRYHEQGEDHSADGGFTAGNEQIYSILWAGDGERSFTLTYHVEGSFRLHSVYG